MKYISLLKGIKLSRKWAIHILLAISLLYFIFHSIYGNRGIISYFKLNNRFQKATEELEDLRAERIEIEHRVKLLRPGSLDKDMLEEQARSVLGVASPNEKVFTPDSKDKKSNEPKD
jgi:cell division protein FtsB